MTYEQETAWLAGLLEGEACFTPTYSKNTDGKFVPANGMRIQLLMNDRDVLERAAKVMGVAVYSEKRETSSGGQVWRCYACGDRAVEIAKRILPLMGERRSKKIKELIELASHRLSRKEIGRRAGLASQEARRKAGLPCFINFVPKRQRIPIQIIKGASR